MKTSNKKFRKINKEHVDFICSLIKENKNIEECKILFLNKYHKSISDTSIYKVSRNNNLKIKKQENKKKIKKEIVINRLNEFGFKLIEKYSRCSGKIKMLCFCGKEFSRFANEVFRGNVESCGCLLQQKKINALKETLSELNMKLLDNENELLKTIKQEKHINLQCLECNYIFKTKVKNATVYRRKCRHCYRLEQFYGYGETNDETCGEINGYVWKCIMSSAKRRKIKVEITRPFIWNLFLKQNKKCALTGIDIKFAQIGENRKETTASLDRIDSDKDYTEDNVQWVWKKVNAMKMDTEEKEFIKICKMIVDYNK